MGGLIFLFLMVAAAWLLLIRPQQQRLRSQRELIGSLSVGQQVVTAGGIIGTIVRMDDRDVGLEVAPGIIVTFLRPAISRRLDPEDTGGDRAAYADSDAAGTETTDRDNSDAGTGDIDTDDAETTSATSATGRAASAAPVAADDETEEGAP